MIRVQVERDTMTGCPALNACTPSRLSTRRLTQRREIDFGREASMRCR
jgi:hypothetical protein